MSLLAQIIITLGGPAVTAWALRCMIDCDRQRYIMRKIISASSECDRLDLMEFDACEAGHFLRLLLRVPPQFAYNEKIAGIIERAKNEGIVR